MSKKTALLIITAALFAIAMILMQNGSRATVQAEKALNSLLSCTLEDVEKLDAALTPQLPSSEPGISSQGAELSAYLAEHFGESMTDNCIEKLAANRTFYRSAKLAKANNCDILMSELKLSARGGSEDTLSFSAVLTANGSTVERISGSVRMVNEATEWKADLITID